MLSIPFLIEAFFAWRTMWSVEKRVSTLKLSHFWTLNFRQIVIQLIADGIVHREYVSC